jgi:molybdopterin-guanine dinucleotide biosynthesis adapter protein
MELYMRVIGITGYSGAGKTTLLTKLIPHLNALGFRVSTLKHAHHAFDVDVAGKDSHTHRQSGAQEVLISSKNRFALIHELRGEEEPKLHDLLQRLSPVDFVLVEGFKRDNHPKLLIHRVGNNKLLLEVSHVRAVISDDETLNATPIDDIEAIAALVLKHAAPLPQVLEVLTCN